MTYYSYEFLIGTVLLLSLLFRLPIIWINIIFLIVVFFTILSYKVGDYYSSWHILLKTLLLILGLFIINVFNTKKEATIEVLVWAIILASLLLVSSENLLSIYILIELQSLSLFVFIARMRNSVSKTEASLKYFILSSIASGVLLLGSAIYFYLNGINDVYALSIHINSFAGNLIVIALLFKLAAAPLHIWIPDVYQGCDNKSILILGTLPKISIIAVLSILMPNIKIILIATIISLIIGCIGAINQTNLRKLLAYSGIINIGFIIFGLSMSSSYGIEASIIYIFMYTLTFFAFIVLVNKHISKISNISEFSGLLGANPVVLTSIGLLVLSFAGIPPLGGFLVKWMILSIGISTGFIITSLISILCAIVAGVYYLRLLKISTYQMDKSFYLWKKALLKDNSVNYNESIILGIIIFVTASILVSPQIITEIIHFGVLSLY